MTGYPELNFPAFYEAEEQLRALGYEVINPARIEQPDKSWQACMRKDIVEMMRADRVVTLPGWDLSRGASVEVGLAESLDIPVEMLDALLMEAAKYER